MTRLLPALALLVALPALGQTAGEPLGAALRAFAEARGLSLVYAPDLVAGRQTTCPAARRTPDRPAPAVLACLLEGTGVEARRLPSGTVALYRAGTRPAPQPPPRPTTGETAPPRTVTLSGVVTDAATGEALIGAAVYVPALGRGATTNAYGFYSLPLPAGETRVVASYVGLVPRQTSLYLGESGRRDFALDADSSGIGEVVVEAVEAAPTQAHPSVVLTGEDVQAIPALAGEADLLKALQLTPGVGGGAEATAGLHVRGGSPDQTLLLLDGVPVYNASHLFGFLSVFNADAVKHVELFKGGFPARYGGRLSSVVDVRVREGNDQERRGHARIGLLSSQVLAEGPVAGGAGSYVVAGRRTYVDLLAAPILLAAGGVDGATPRASFYDLNAKVNGRLGDRDRVFLSLYAGRDGFGASVDEDPDEGQTESDGELEWGNLTGALRWTRLVSDRLFATTTLTASDYQFDVGQRSRRGGETVGAEYRSGIRDLAVQTDLAWTASAAHTVRVGGAVTRHAYAPGVFDFDPSGAEADTTLGADPVGSWEGAVYVEDEARLGPLAVGAGVRASAYAVEGTAYGAVEPRLSARLDVGGGLALRASGSRMTQYLHLLTTAGGLGLPADLWVPATARVGPERAWQASAGLEGRAGRTTWSLDGYAKTMTGLVAYRDDAALLRADDDWQDQVTQGEGRAVGVEAAVAYAGPRTSAQAAYTLSRTDRRFDEVEGGAQPAGAQTAGAQTAGAWFPYRYDRTHDLAVAVRHRLSQRFDVSAAAFYQTGQAVTLPVARFYTARPGYDLTDGGEGSGGGAVEVYGPRNGFRLPAYARADVALDLYFRRGPRPHALSLHVYNVTNRANAFYATVETRPDPETGEAAPVVVGRSVLPIVPTLSYQFSF